MFDASVGATEHRIRDATPVAFHDAYHNLTDTVLRAPAAGPAFGPHAAGNATEWSSDLGKGAAWQAGAGTHATEASTPVEAVLFVDPRVANWQTLVDGVTPGTEVIVLDPNQDGLAQVSAVLSRLSNVQTINFLTYGTSGQIELGASDVDAATLLANASEVAGWRDHMADNAQILIWGCDVGAGTAGAAFVADLHALTGAGVAASIDATGAASLGGDWTLEQTAGVVQPAVPFSAAAIAAYQNVLDAPLPTVAFTNVPTQVLLGASFSETVSFTNAAVSAVGYGPIVEVFAPNNSLDVATLSSATYLGTTLPYAQVTLSTTVPGHSGTLGALDPAIVDASGNAVFVNAPAGTMAGDSMYVIQLPFGSFTPGQPAINVVMTFATTNTSVLTAQHGGQQVTTDAIGGFIYGADPLNNPATDLPIQGTAGTQGIVTPATGEVSASTSLVLATVTTTVVTPVGENETPTGPDFVSSYQVTITPAPATVGNPVAGTTMQLVLPDNVEYTGGPITVTGSAGTATFIPGTAPQGGAVTISIPTLSASAGATVVSIPFYVPQTDASGAPILDPVTGAPTTIGSPVLDYNNGTWDPWVGSADEGNPYTVAGGIDTGASFTAKSLAMQLTAIDLSTNSATQTYPDDEVQYTLTFQVSDYFNMDSLSLQGVLSDGIVVDPTVAPTLRVTPAGGSATSLSLGTITATYATVNGELVPVVGSNANWNFVNYNNAGAPSALTPGQTEINLQTASVLLAAVGSSTLGAGETGALTFDATVLDKYTNTNVDPATSAPSSITELDTVSSVGTATATVFTTGGVPTDFPPVTVSDGSSNTLTVPPGTGSVYVTAINGVAVTGAATVNAGDTVTYALTRTLSTGDFGALDLTAYLPLPVLDAADPASNGSTVTTYTLDTSAPGSSTFYPGLGEYSFFVAPTPGGSAPAYSVQSADVTSASNSVTFDLGHHDDPTNVHDQTVTVYFTVKASTAPFADGLQLTTQGQTGLTNGAGTTNSTESIAQITVAEPNLVNQIKNGIVSLVNDAGTALSGDFTVDGTSTPDDPTGFYAAAGTPVTSGRSLFVGPFNVGPTSLTDLQNLNVAGADGSDTARIVETIANSGSGDGGAYDIVVSDTLPAGYTIADVSNLAVVRSGTLTQLVPQSGSLMQVFTTAGVTLEDPNSTATEPAPTLFTTGDVLHRDVLTISFDLTLHANQSAGTVLTNTATVLNYSNIYNGVALGNGFVVGGNPVGGTAADLIDTATITTIAPVLAKTFAASDIPQNDNVDPSYPNATVVVGETRPVTITVTLPEGSLTNGSSDVMVTELLPADETFTGLISIVGSTGVSFTLPGTPYSVSGNTVTFDLGPQVLNSNSDAPGTVSIAYTARFADGTNTNNTLFTSTANLIYSGSPVAPAQVTFIEHDPMLSATLTDNSGGVVYSNALVTYTYTVKNTGIVQAQSTDALLDLPTGLTYVSGTLHLVSQSGTPDSSATVNDSSGGSGILTVAPNVFDPSGTLVYSFEATVNPGLLAGTDLTVTSPTSGNSALSINNAFARNYTFSASDPLSVGSLVTSLYFAAEANGTSTVTPGTSSSIDVTVGDIVRVHAVAQTPEGRQAAVVLDFTLPNGLVPYTSDDTVTLALVSPNGSITSSTLDPTGTLPGLQVTNAQVANVATFAPTYVVPAVDINTTTNPGHVLINLGSIQNDAGSPLPNYVIVEFNVQAQNVASNQAGTVLTDSFAAHVNISTTPSASQSETVVEPTVTLSKAVTAISSSAGTASYLVTLTNTGSIPAYDVSVTDPLPASNVASLSTITPSGGATDLVVTPGGANIFAATMNLAAGTTETFVYQLTVASVTAPVPATTTSETYQDINPTVTGLTYNGLTSVIGTTGSTTGSRDGSSIPGAGLNDYWAQVTTSLGTASGEVWQALGDTPATYDSSIDTTLGGVLITVTASRLTETATTAADGSYIVGLIPNGTFTVTLPASGASGLPVNETLVVNPYGTLTPPGHATATASGTALTGINFVYEIPDTAPVLGNWASGTQTIAPSQVAALSTTGAATAADTELNILVGAHSATYSYSGAVLTLERYTGGVAAANAADVFGGDAQLTLAGGTVTLSGVAVGTYIQSGGVLSITLNSNATAASVQGVLDHLTYSNASTGTLALNLTIGATLSDGNLNNVALATGFTGAQGTGGVMTGAPVYSVFTLLPNTSPYTTTFTEPNNTPVTGAAITLPSANLANLLAPGATLSQVSILLGGGTAAAEDVLAFVAGAATGNIAGAFNASAGTLTLTSAGSTATIAQWQAALGGIQYYDSSAQPYTTARSVTYSLTSTGAGGTATEQLGTINVVATDDSPILNSAAVLSLPTATEDGSGPPTGAVGALVSTLANVGDISDLDGNNAHDGSAPGPSGLAIIATDTTVGNWWYSTNGGTTWTEFSGAGLPAISASNALHLVADANTRIYFEPTLADFNGAITPALTFRAWDLFDGAANGSLSALPTDSALGTGINTLAAAYSSATISVNQVILPVNDAPIASGNSTLAAVPEDTTAPPGATVSTLFDANFSDTADQQQSLTNPTGSVANTLAGVAVVGDTTPTSEGVWRYSTNGGTTWINISTSVSDSSSVVLPVSAEIDFLPAPNFNGAPLPLTERVIDNSTDVPITGAVTGLALQGGTVAYTNVDVSGTLNGGETAVSAATVSLNTAITAVNDAPIASGSATLATVPEDTTSPPGATVATLFAANFSDTADQQQSIVNPTGSVANTLAGVAIIGDTTPSSEGVWRYSTNGGATWTNISTSVSDSSAVVLPASAEIAFLPVPDFNGAPLPLTERVIDNSTDVPITGAVTGLALQSGTAAYIGVDVSGAHNGGETAISAATVSLTTAISPVNDAPIASGIATLNSVPEDTTSPPGETVGTLFAANFSDTADQQQATINPTGSVANTLAGVAIVGNVTPSSVGVWEYSTNSGATWTTIPTSVSDSNAIILPVSAEIAFLPVTNFNGLLPPLVERVIDNSTDVPVTGAVTGLALQSGTTAYSGVDVSGAHNGGDTAISAAKVPLITEIDPVNDAPIASGSATLPPIPEDVTAPPGESVNLLFGANFSDEADNVPPVSPFGSVANTLAGVAIIADPTPTSEGVWRYSTNGGASWTNIPTNVSDSSALILPASAEIGFLPVPNFNGAPLVLTERLIDSSTDVPVTGTVTGADLQAGTTVYTGVDVSGTHNGGNTAISTGTVPLATEVIPVNDAPIASGSVALPDISAANQHPPGETVATLFAPTFSDTVDQQRTAINPTGSLANILAGVVVVGDTTPAADGTWRYSSNGGATWTAVPTSVSDSNGILLGSSVQLAFFPKYSFHGDPPPLQVRLVDNSSDVPITGTLTGTQLAGTATVVTGVDVAGTNNGGITSISVGLVPVNVHVLAAGNPVFPPKPTDPFAPIDTLTGEGGLQPGWLVGSTVYRSLTTEQSGTINVSADAFYGSDAAQHLTYEAGTASGGPLPPWLNFDAATLTFSGVPPESAAGTLDLRVLARDQAGNQATAEVHLFITHNTTDLMRLLVRARSFAQPRKGSIIPPHRVVPRPVPPPSPPSPALSPRASGDDPTHRSGAGTGRLGFTAQMREHAMAGRLSRARAMLSSLSNTAGTE